MAGQIRVIGLGPGGSGYLTAGAVAALQSGASVYLRTGIHPTVTELDRLGVRYQTFDAVYEQASTFAQVYETIARSLLDAAQEQDVVFAVPGHPAMGEEAVRLLLEAAPSRGIAVQVEPAVSCLDVILPVVGYDPIGGLEVLDGLDMAAARPSGRVAAIVLQLHSRAVAGEIKLALSEVYPDEHRVCVVGAAGVPGQQRVEAVPLHELDRLDWLDHLTSLFLPPLPVAAEAASHVPAPLGAPSHVPAPVEAASQAAAAFARLVEVMAILRGPGGCPWDQEQTHRTLRPYLLEEVYEVLEAIDIGQAELLQEELGDVLLQVVFHGQMAQDAGTFTTADVVSGIVAKLIRRHPHVFADTQVGGAADVVRNWEAIKALEKAADPTVGAAPPPKSILAGVSRALPAVMRAHKLQKRAAKVGFDWPDITGAMDKLHEELCELQEVAAPGSARAEEELGDLLFAAVNLARFLQLDPEVALTNTNAKFMRRFECIEVEARRLGIDLAKMTLSEMDDLWNRAKEAE